MEAKGWHELQGAEPPGSLSPHYPAFSQEPIQLWVEEPAEMLRRKLSPLLFSSVLLQPFWVFFVSN